MTNVENLIAAQIEDLIATQIWSLREREFDCFAN
jgi:hypothetical protein